MNSKFKSFVWNIIKPAYEQPTVLRLLESILTSYVLVGACVYIFLYPKYHSFLTPAKIVATIAVFRCVWFMTFFDSSGSHNKGQKKGFFYFKIK